MTVAAADRVCIVGAGPAACLRRALSGYGFPTTSSSGTPRGRHLGHRQPRHADVRDRALHLLADTSGFSATRCRTPTPTTRAGGRSSRTSGRSPRLRAARADPVRHRGRPRPSTRATALAWYRLDWRAAPLPRGCLRDRCDWHRGCPTPGRFTGEVRHSVTYRTRGVPRPAGAGGRCRELRRRHRVRRRADRRRRFLSAAPRLPVHPQAPLRRAGGRRSRTGPHLPLWVERPSSAPAARVHRRPDPARACPSPITSCSRPTRC